MANIQQYLNKNHPNTVLMHTLQQMYELSNIKYTFDQSYIYIYVKFPLIKRNDIYTTFKVTSIPIALSSKSVAFTEITQLPEILAISVDGSFFAELSNQQLNECEGSKSIKICRNIYPTVNKLQTCSMATIFKNISQSKLLCSHKMKIPIKAEQIQSKIITINESTFYVAQRSLGPWRLKCEKNETEITPCNHCQITIPCKCRLKIGDTKIPPAMCQPANSEHLQIKFHINWILLSQLYNEDDLSKLEQIDQSYELSIADPHIDKTHVDKFALQSNYLEIDIQKGISAMK